MKSSKIRIIGLCIDLFTVLWSNTLMENPPYIQVAVPLPVDHPYTYQVPEHLQEEAAVGMRAVVPFGRRRLTGYILSFSKDAGEYQPKSILDLPDEFPLFPPAMIPFFKWIADYYIHPLGQVIQTALPQGLNRQDVTLVSLTPEGLEALNGRHLPPRTAALLKALKNHRSLPVKRLEKLVGGSGLRALLRRMEAQGLIQRTVTLKKDRARMKTEPFVRFLKGPDDPASLSKKRRLILDRAREHGEYPLSLLKKEVATAPRLVKILQDSGYVTRVDKEVYRDPLGETVMPDTPPDLTQEQQAVIRQVEEMPEGAFQGYLLSGVTGSGKTEVYLQLVSRAAEKGRGAIVLVPEISLISQTERRFRARFGNRIAVIHSGLTMGERLDQWVRILKGELSIVIGPRSALFAPLSRPGIIIVDEEHDTSYKQESGLKYNARDLALVRAKLSDAVVVLGSATPSIQSYYNSRRGKLTELTLAHRVNQRPLPEIQVVDLKKYRDYRGTQKIITPELSREITGCLDRGEQAIIFLNRRGFAPFPVCESCGETIKCRFCDITMTLHKSHEALRCHLCGAVSPLTRTCTHCGAEGIKPLGVGTEKVEGLLKTMFPEARVARLDQDTGSRKGAVLSILKQVRNRTIDIIVGTQMLAKGHDFPGITLVGIICADLGLNFPDFRSGERTFQLLAQVAGRAGRGERPGRVIMQTYTPDHFSIETSRHQDFRSFYHQEIPFRKSLGYPPCARMVQLKLSSGDPDKVREHARFVGELCRAIQKEMDKDGAQIRIMGPIEAGIPRIAMQYRWQILLKSPWSHVLKGLITQLKQDKTALGDRHVRVSIDVDPYFMM